MDEESWKTWRTNNFEEQSYKTKWNANDERYTHECNTQNLSSDFRNMYPNVLFYIIQSHMDYWLDLIIIVSFLQRDMLIISILSCIEIAGCSQNLMISSF